jgi:transposase InsO family protein
LGIFGHLGFGNFYRLAGSGFVYGLNIPTDALTGVHVLDCPGCQRTRRRLPRKTCVPVSERQLQLLHMDVCGPMPVASLGGSRYFLTVLDDFSRLSVVRCIARKADVPDVLRAVIVLLETQSNRLVQRIRSDRGGEFVNHSLANYYNSKGIVRVLTAGYSPESNGAAERVRRTLMDRVRAMLLDSCLPAALWGEAVVAACYVRNRSPVSEVSQQTPWGLFCDCPPDVSNLRVFGCKVHAHVPEVCVPNQIV